MHICILMANTDVSTFSNAHPADGEKFAQMFDLVRSGWRMSVFSVKDGEFPPEDAKFDGWLITGSPASVHDEEPWVERLFGLIRLLVARGDPLFGACFGHQAIAMALGGTVGPNPGGWVFGCVETEMEATNIRLYAAHSEQVLMLPAGAVSLGGSVDCPVGSFSIGPKVLTTQYHPEMTHAFVAALTDEYADKLPPPVVNRARESLKKEANSLWIAERIATFFEAA